MVDRVQPLKMEDPGSGGVETDPGPTALDRNEDFVDCRGLSIQNDTSDDEAVQVSRDVDDSLFFKDPIAGTQTLSDLVAGAGGLTEEGHKVLRQLVHFITDGPAEGFTSGAYRETTGTVFPSAIVWWDSVAKTKKIVEKLLTWTGAFPTTIAWKVYDAAGSLVATVSDAITYSGSFETNRTRTITVE